MWYWTGGFWWPGFVLMAGFMVICMLMMVRMMGSTGGMGMCGFGRSLRPRDEQNADDRAPDDDASTDVGSPQGAR
jgi:hypothetical protein